jgi:hypothetical protein
VNFEGGIFQLSTLILEFFVLIINKIKRHSTISYQIPPLPSRHFFLNFVEWSKSFVICSEALDSILVILNLIKWERDRASSWL